MCVFIYPSHNLLKTKFTESQIKLSSNHAGEVFWIESQDKQFLTYYLQNTSLTQITDTKYFGALSLYAEPKATLSGFTKVNKGIFSHPQQNILISNVEIKTRPLDNPASIRIPASFFTDLEKIGTTQIEQEKHLIKSSILKETQADGVCMETLQPIKSARTSKFGSYRRLPTGMQYFHTGLDLRAAVGTPVYAMADGEVTLAQNFVVPGGAVIIDHGNAIYSKYYHLSALEVQPGQKIKKGDLIAKSGGTGRVEAPHLHWEVSWKGIPTDPVVFMDTVKTICL